MGRGGKREGSGRPKGSGKYGEQTKAVRLPVSKLELLPELLKMVSAPTELDEATTHVATDSDKTVDMQSHVRRKAKTRSPELSPEIGTIVEDVFSPDCSTRYRLPLYMNPVSAGSPAFTEDYVEGKLDLNRHLVRHPTATFIVRVTGDSMIDAGIHPGDMLIVDRSLEAADGKVVIAVVDGELTVKRISIDANRLFLLPHNTNYQPLKILPEMDFFVWGVVTNVIHPL
ncbi:translesion error-prone DNA polymerase V autoproteolytic subunit [Tumidithrix helvetica PCC 7403]|uniref:LexA family protein n=1 Tax=Tumidithrix helvetica TaxID=3457545 RepID=UPI003C884825